MRDVTRHRGPRSLLRSQARRAKLTFIDSERDEPTGTVNHREAAGRASFLVASRGSEAEGDGERAIHEGFFLAVDDADAYRQAQPDSDALAVVVVHDRYPLRDLTQAELTAGEIDPAVDAAKGLTGTIDRIYREAGA